MKRPSNVSETRSDKFDLDTELELTPAQLEQSVGGAERRELGGSTGITAMDDWEAPVI